MQVAYDAAMLDHETGPGHVERPARLKRAIDELQSRPWWDPDWLSEPEPIDDDRVHAVHDEAMVERTRRTVGEGGGWLDPDTVVSDRSWQAARLAAGATIRAAEAAVDGEPAYALVRPPGHHATPSQAMGFCLLNNVAIAARALLDAGLADRVAVLDHDVHHGNGTQDVFYADGDALYLSIHQSPLYPGTGDVGETGIGDGDGRTVNVPVPAGTGDATYLALIEDVACPVAEQFDPDLWLVSAGYDAHADDPLGGLELTTEAFAAILDRIAGVEDRIACVLEGGYDLGAVADSVAAQVGWLAGEVEAPDMEAGDAGDLVAKVRGEVGAWWEV